MNDIRIILPKDEKTLHRWLTQINLTVMVLSIPFVGCTVMMLLTNDVLSFMKFGLLALVILLCSSTLVVLEYILAIEFNSRGFNSGGSLKNKPRRSRNVSKSPK